MQATILAFSSRKDLAGYLHGGGRIVELAHSLDSAVEKAKRLKPGAVLIEEGTTPAADIQAFISTQRTRDADVRVFLFKSIEEPLKRIAEAAALSDEALTDAALKVLGSYVPLEVDSVPGGTGTDKPPEVGMSRLFVVFGGSMLFLMLVAGALSFALSHGYVSQEQVRWVTYPLLALALLAFILSVIGVLRSSK